MYRDLTPEEQRQAVEQFRKRTKSEKRAYHLLPQSMKEKVELNPAVAFTGCNAYYPDLFWRKAKICVEIDGGYHCRRTWYDTKRDSVFEQHGFATIRIKNRDVFVNVAFWQRLLEGLEKLHGDHPGMEQYIKELATKTPSADELVVIKEGRDNRNQEVVAFFDGSGKIEMSTGDSICIEKSTKITKIIKLNRVSFLEVLGKKFDK